MPDVFDAHATSARAAVADAEENDADEDEGYEDDDDEDDVDEDVDDPYRFLREEDSQAPNLVPEENPRNVLAGRIEILDMIGQGAMGAVWRGLHLKLERRVAVKVLDETLQLRTDGRERFVREARALALLDHPGVVRVHDCDELPDGKLYLCMELIEGETLREVIRRGPLDAIEVIDIGRRVSDAVETAHQQGILHRDLSPSNIMRSYDKKTIKVIDWGLCKYLDLFYIRSTQKYPAPPGSRLVTPLGARFGTPEYMAPEMILREDPGPPSFRTDVYALGVVLYELLTGRHAFAPGDRREPRPIREALPEFEYVELEAALREAVRFDPVERTQTMATFREALERARECLLASRASNAALPGAEVGAAESIHGVEFGPPSASAAASSLATCLAESATHPAVLPVPAVVTHPPPRRTIARLGLALVVGASSGALGTIVVQRFGTPEGVPAGSLATQLAQETVRARAAELRVDRCEAALEAMERPAVERSSSPALPAPSEPLPDVKPSPAPEVLAARADADKAKPPKRARSPIAVHSGTFAGVMARMEPKIRACAREAGVVEEPVTVQVRYKGGALDGVRVLRLSKEHALSICAEKIIRSAAPPPGTSPIEDFTFFAARGGAAK